MADTEKFMEQWITDPTAAGIELPDFVVQIGSYTNSTDQGGAGGGASVYANFIKLFRYTERLSRPVNPNAINQLFSGGRMESSVVGIEIPRVNGLSNMINALANGENIPQIIIQRIGYIQKGSKVIEKVEYDNCLFTLYHYVTVSDANGNISDRARLAFRPLKRTHTIISYKQDDGTQQGQTQSIIDFTTGDFSLGGGDSGGGAAGGGGDSGGGAAGGGGSAGGDSI